MITATLAVIVQDNKLLLGERKKGEIGYCRSRAQDFDHIEFLPYDLNS